MTSRSERQGWLLLLSHPPFPFTLANFRSTYGKAIEESLLKASQATKSSSRSQTLDVAVACPSLLDDGPRSARYQSLQHLICQLYRLICIIGTEHSIDPENGNDVDTSVNLIEPGDSSSDTGKATKLNLQSLASSHSPWKHLLATNDEAGKALLDTFVQSRGSYGQQLIYGLNIGLVSSGAALEDQNQSPKEQIGGHESQRHYSVAVGGTFDHLHAGHKLLITMTALVLEPDSHTDPRERRTLTIGITGDTLLKNKQYAEVLEDWNQRQQGVRDFLSAFLILDCPGRALSTTDRSTNPQSDARIVRDEFKSGLVVNYVEIFDPFGPTITNESISALVVSAETRSGGKAVNERRSENGWAALEVFEVDVLNAGDDNADAKPSEEGFQDKISSTAIRRKIHNRRSDALS